MARLGEETSLGLLVPSTRVLMDDISSLGMDYGWRSTLCCVSVGL